MDDIKVTLNSGEKIFIRLEIPENIWTPFWSEEEREYIDNWLKTNVPTAKEWEVL